MILNINGEQESRRAALKILDIALSLDDLVLLKDLVRFLDLNPSNNQVANVSITWLFFFECTEVLVCFSFCSGEISFFLNLKR